MLMLGFFGLAVHGLRCWAMCGSVILFYCTGLPSICAFVPNGRVSSWPYFNLVCQLTPCAFRHSNTSRPCCLPARSVRYAKVDPAPNPIWRDPWTRTLWLGCLLVYLQTSKTQPEALEISCFMNHTDSSLHGQTGLVLLASLIHLSHVL